MADELKVYGIWSEQENDWYRGFSDHPVWSFDKEYLEGQLSPNPTLKESVRELTDTQIAQIPEAANAFIAWLNIQEAKERFAQIRGHND